MRKIGNLLCLLCIALPLTVAQTPADTDGGWPQEVDSNGSHIQPQVEGGGRR